MGVMLASFIVRGLGWRARQRYDDQWVRADSTTALAATIAAQRCPARAS